jgi:dihydrofolate reductase
MIRIIVATDSDGGIAKHGIQPWSIPDDEQYFQAQTLKFGGAILMGHKTYETIGSALPNRHNYVASRAPLHEANIEQVTDIANFLTHYKDGQDLWVIGGAAIYEQSLASADELYINPNST